VEVPLLHEKPYAEMTLRWLEEQGIQFRNDNWKSFVIPGGQHYTPFQKAVPGDFSSATFFAAAAAITGASIELEGLDMADSQGDKLVFLILSKMGCRIDYLKGKTLIAQAGGTSDTDDAESAYTQAISQGTDGIRVCGPSRMGRPLRGGRFDLNSIPDALPALAVVACFSVGQVELVNVPQARLKETDRISVMTQELGTMGATIQELEDGMIITPTRTPEGLSGLVGAEVQGHDDHRVVMSLAVAGLVAQGSTRIIGAEAAAVTYPGFFDTLRSLSSDSKALALS
jgi:3-phosphoshikimate 1-carboxyvinyltransferase